MDIRPWLDQARRKLGHWPTPLEPMERLSAELGGPTIWLKRDDCTGLAGGGNKTRKLEYLIADALAQNADTVVTFGAVQSNHARQTAAACAKNGLACHQILTRTVLNSQPDYENGGNVFLSKLFGAKQHLVDEAKAPSYAAELLNELRTSGHTPYVIPPGGSNALGALGYANCAEELQQQCLAAGIELRYIMHASSSAGTQAGLLFGLHRLGCQARVLGINVYHRDPKHLEERIENLLKQMNETYQAKESGTPEVLVNHAYYGEGYAQPSAECLSAIRLAAATEGLLFDPVYSGKALAAMIDQVTLGNLREYTDVLLIHTGGAPALHVYDQCF